MFITVFQSRGKIRVEGGTSYGTVQNENAAVGSLSTGHSASIYPTGTGNFHDAMNWLLK